MNRVDKILGTKGTKYKVRWAGFDASEDTFEPLVNLAGNAKFQEWVKNNQAQLRESCPIVQALRDMSPAELKARLKRKYWNGNALDKLALQTVFRMTPDRDPQLAIDT